MLPNNGIHLPTPPNRSPPPSESTLQRPQSRIETNTQITCNPTQITFANTGFPEASSTFKQLVITPGVPPFAPKQAATPTRVFGIRAVPPPPGMSHMILNGCLDANTLVVDLRTAAKSQGVGPNVAILISTAPVKVIPANSLPTPTQKVVPHNVLGPHPSTLSNQYPSMPITRPQLLCFEPGNPPKSNEQLSRFPLGPESNPDLKNVQVITARLERFCNISLRGIIFHRTTMSMIQTMLAETSSTASPAHAEAEDGASSIYRMASQAERTQLLTSLQAKFAQHEASVIDLTQSLDKASTELSSALAIAESNFTAHESVIPRFRAEAIELCTDAGTLRAAAKVRDSIIQELRAELAAEHERAKTFEGREQEARHALEKEKQVVAELRSMLDEAKVIPRSQSSEVNIESRCAHEGCAAKLEERRNEMVLERQRTGQGDIRRKQASSRKRKPDGEWVERGQVLKKLRLVDFSSLSSFAAAIDEIGRKAAQ